MSKRELEGLLYVLEKAHPMWPLFVGHPETGEPVELSKEAYEQIKQLVRQAIAERQCERIS